MDTTPKSLAERVDSFPEAWRPKAGDKLVGTVVAIDMRDSEYGEEPYPIVTIGTEDGDEFAFHGFHTVARNELSKQRPRVGDEIALKYFGKNEERGYERYRVLVIHADQPETPIDWDAVAVEADTGTATSTDEWDGEKDTGTATPIKDGDGDLPMGPADAPA